jgi:hypothetical protein
MPMASTDLTIWADATEDQNITKRKNGTITLAGFLKRTGKKLPSAR